MDMYNFFMPFDAIYDIGTVYVNGLFVKVSLIQNLDGIVKKHHLLRWYKIYN